MFLRRKKYPVREHILGSGEKIIIRQLSPAERLRCLSLPGDLNLGKRLSLGLVQPKISTGKAIKLLNTEPFKALEILRAIQLFSRETDLESQEKWQNLQDKRFLNVLRQIESLKRKS